MLKSKIPASTDVVVPKDPKTDEKHVSPSSPSGKEKRVAAASGSSSCSSDSGSSSSDSDSESSSAHGSDAGHSPSTWHHLISYKQGLPFRHEYYHRPSELLLCTNDSFHVLSSWDSNIAQKKLCLRSSGTSSWLQCSVWNLNCTGNGYLEEREGYPGLLIHRTISQSLGTLWEHCCGTESRACVFLCHWLGSLCSAVCDVSKVAH